MSEVSFTKLAAPFGDEKIEWRIQRTGKKNGRIWAKVVPHPDARYLMDRLDEAVGPENWKCAYLRGPSGGVVCDLSIRVDGEWISKEDGASSEGESEYVDPVKSTLTNAFKRACVPWNVGGIRSLYHVGTQWAEVHDGGERRDKYVPKGENGKPDYKRAEWFNWDPPSLEDGSGNDQQRPHQPSRAEAEPEPSTDLPPNEEGGRVYKQKVWAWFKGQYETAKEAQSAWTAFAVRHPTLPGNPEDWDEMHCTTALAYLEEHGRAILDSDAKLPEQPSLV